MMLWIRMKMAMMSTVTGDEERLGFNKLKWDVRNKFLSPYSFYCLVPLFFSIKLTFCLSSRY